MAEEDLDLEEKLKIAEMIDSGAYFKNAFDWYNVKYLSSMADRSMFILLSILGVFIVMNVYWAINSMLPLKEDVAIVLAAKDTARYRPKLHDLTKETSSKATDEMMLEYLVKNYVREWDGHNYKSADVRVFNNKMNFIRNNSSINVFQQFQELMGRDNPNSPVHFFGRDVEMTVRIDSFSFIRGGRQSFGSKVSNFFLPDMIPNQAVVDYTVTTTAPSMDGLTMNTARRRKRAVIGFNFNGIDMNPATGSFLPLNFIVTKYDARDV